MMFPKRQVSATTTVMSAQESRHSGPHNFFISCKRCGSKTTLKIRSIKEVEVVCDNCGNVEEALLTEV